MMGTFIQFHDNAHLNILPTLSSAEILLRNWAQENLCEGLEFPFK